MVPEEKLWSPKIEMPEQCKYCEMWFHHNIGGICNPCYQVMSRELYNQPAPEFSHCSVARRSGLPAVDDAEDFSECQAECQEECLGEEE